MSLGLRPVDSREYLISHGMLLLSSFFHQTGRDLLNMEASVEEQALALFSAPFGVVSHGCERSPIFNYGNSQALALFEMDWRCFVFLESRFSAQPQAQSERDALLARVADKGFSDDFRGVRVSSTGQLFYVEKATLWNIVDSKGDYKGQAAALYAYSQC